MQEYMGEWKTTKTGKKLMKIFKLVCGEVNGKEVKERREERERGYKWMNLLIKMNKITLY
jgi:hypothetical protein